jgi:hypothetical protein
VALETEMTRQRQVIFLFFLVFLQINLNDGALFKTSQDIAAF